MGQNHVREGLSNNSRDGGALVPRRCPGMAQLAGLDEPRVNPAPQMDGPEKLPSNLLM